MNTTTRHRGRRAIGAVLITAAMVLAACSDDTTSSTTTAAPETTGAAETTAAPETTLPPKSPILIVGTIDLTGLNNRAEAGKVIEAWAAFINAKGPVPVPEPGVAVLFGSCAALVMLRRRRGMRQSPAVA